MAVFITPTALTWVVVGTTQWVTYNLTGIIPTNATGVILNYAQLNGYQNTIQVRKKGSTDSLLPNNITGLNEQTVLYCGVDSSQNFEFYTEASYDGNQLWVLGYFTSDATFSTNATALAATTAATWTSYNLSSSAPNAIAAIIYLPYYGGSVRKNGSTDAYVQGLQNYNEASPGARYFIVGLDSSQICQLFTYTSSVPYLMGYITSGITWNTNAIVRTPATAGSFQSLTRESNATGYLYLLNSPSTFYSYSLSSTTVSGYALNLGNPGQLNGQAPSGGRQAQINIQNTGLAVYEVGYFTTNPFFKMYPNGAFQSPEFIETNGGMKMNSNGAVQISNLIESGPGSISFDGATQELDISSLSTITGTGTFTIETWVYPLGYSDQCIGSSTVDPNLQIFRLNENGSGGAPAGISVYDQGTQVFQNVGTGTYPVANKWTHLAWVKNGTTNTLYINGISSATYTGNVPNFTPNVIGVFYYFSSATDYWFKGYITNYRIVNGTAVYTSNFTPPTSPLLSVTNTLLLLDVVDSTNYITDNSPNNFTVTPVGSPTFSVLSPYSNTNNTNPFNNTPQKLYSNGFFLSTQFIEQ